MGAVQGFGPTPGPMTRLHLQRTDPRRALGEPTGQHQQEEEMAVKTPSSAVVAPCKCGAVTFGGHVNSWNKVESHGYTGPSYPDRRSCCGKAHEGRVCPNGGTTTALLVKRLNVHGPKPRYLNAGITVSVTRGSNSTVIGVGGIEYTADWQEVLTATATG